MYDVLETVGLNPRSKVYKASMNRLFLRNVKVTEANIKNDQKDKILKKI